MKEQLDPIVMYRKKHRLNERITLSVEPELRELLIELRSVYSIDVQEMLRVLLRKELPKLKEKLTHPACAP
jgi:hypothetical protein